MNKSAKDKYLQSVKPRILEDYQEDSYWIEENPNYVLGQGNLFLMRCTDKIMCVGGIDIERGNTPKWIASISKPYDERTDSDCDLIYSGSREEAINALWNARHQAY